MTSRCYSAETMPNPRRSSSELQTEPRDPSAGRDPTQLLVYRVWHTENALSRALDDALRPLGTSVAQCSVLFHLDLHEALSAADLSRLIHVTPQGIASTVRRLAGDGLIDRRPHPVHGRIVVLTLTAAGRRVLADAWRVADELEALVTQDVPASDQATLVRALDRMRARISPERA
jgi:DNA-binding MarR family transcriptional regulator